MYTTMTKTNTKICEMCCTFCSPVAFLHNLGCIYSQADALSQSYALISGLK